MLPFLTDYDPLGGANASIDPLGALQAYGALADMLLPGMSTVTTRSRCFSMLCAALQNAEAHRRFLPAAAGLAQRRVALEPFERLWALACVAARQQGCEGAADGLRGVRLTQARYREIRAANRSVDVNFRMLQDQGRTGAIGTYWTTLVGGQLVDPDTGALTAEGRDLADEFPELPLTTKDRAKLCDPQDAKRVTASLADVEAWGLRSHLLAAEPSERNALGETLTADDRRNYVAEALREMERERPLPASWTVSSVRRLRQVISRNAAACNLGLPVVLDAVVVTERFHEAVLSAFGSLLFWATEHGGKSVQDLFSDTSFKTACHRCVETARSLHAFWTHCGAPHVRNAISGFVAFAAIVSRLSSVAEIVEAILQRHHQVQSGKVNGGVPKQDWIGRDGQKLLRPSPRFQLRKPPPAAEGKALTHPYRLEQFVHMLRENDVLPRERLVVASSN
jgi:hypothetical protein